MPRKLARLSLVALVAQLDGGAAASATGVWHVAPAGADFAQIQSAVNAAGDGDIVLVAPGGYAGFEVAGKSLTLVADGAGAIVNGPVTVRDLLPGAVCRLRGIDLAAAGVVFSAEDCAGGVWLEDLAIAQSGVQGAAPAALIEDCAWVGMAGVEITTANASGASVSGGAALLVRNSGAWIHDSTLTGGRAANGAPSSPSGGLGGSALLAEDAVLFVGGSTLVGGRGGDGAYFDPGPWSPPICGPGGHGGHAIEWTASSSETLLDCALVPGAGGLGPDLCPNGATGLAVAPLDSTTRFAGSARVLAASAVTREGGSVALTLGAPPMDVALLLVSPVASALALDQFQGVLVPDVPLFLVALGAVEANGTLAASFPLGELGPGVDGLVLAVQSVSCGAEGCVLSPPSLVVLLDQQH